MQDIELWGFLAGLGLFLLGMFMLEQGLRGLGSKAMKKFLREQTRSPLRGVITGTAVTTFLQSSSLVGLIVLAFVGAGILELRNALGIILGSNLGTTFTGWIVTTLGFKLDLMVFAQPMLALGALATVFTRSGTRIYFYSNLLLGLGLLLLGLSEMTTAFTILAESVDVSIFQGHNMFVYFIGGALFTAIIQSSSAAMMIILTALYTGVLSLNEAAPIAIGADLGTTSTVLLGSLSGITEKRRVALSHFFFNLVTDVLALLMFPALIYLITNVFNVSDPLYSLVIFHSLFNVIGIAIFIPFLGYFIRFLEWLVPGKEDADQICLYIRKVSPDIVDAAIEAVRKELARLFVLAIELNLRSLKLKPGEIFSTEMEIESNRHTVYEDDYALLKRSSGEILGYTYLVQGAAKEEEDAKELTQLNHAIRNVTYAAKFIKDIRHNLVEFRHSPSDVIIHIQDVFHKDMELIHRGLAQLFQNKNPELASEYYLSLKSEIRNGYERFMQNIYSVSGENRIDDEETATLLNINRAAYLSSSALLEVLHVLVITKEDVLIQQDAIPGNF